MIVSCDQCGVKLKVDENKIKEGGSKLRCPKCQNIFTVFRPQDQPQAAPPPPPPPVQAPPAPSVQAPPPPPQAAPAPQVNKWNLDRRKVVVAHSGDTVRSLVASLLNGAGFDTVAAADGVQAMMDIEKHKPAVVILDVALPSIFGFEICDRLKNNPESSDIKIVLIASIFDKTKYKREPTTLYGADDYIEKHHIQDYIAKKVNRLLSPVAAGAPVQREEEAYASHPHEDVPERRQQADQMRQEEVAPPPSAPVDDQQVEAARRFARIILSDIALYNQNAVEEGIRNNNFAGVLKEELREGRDLYNSRVPEEVRSQMDYYADEIEKFIDKKKRLMEMSG